MRTLRIAAALVLTLVLGAAAGSAADVAAINLIQLPADSSAEVYYAQDLGFFKDAGLDVHITPMTNSAAIVASLVGGAGDIGNSVIGSAAQARAKGIRLRFIAPAGLFIASEPTSALVVPKNSPLHTAADLTGKTVAVSGLQDLTYYATRAWIDRHGGDSTKVKFVELPFPAMGPALATHRIDAAYDVEPFLTASRDEFRVFGNAAAAVADRFQATGWVATESWLATHADVALRFAAVMRRTALWANAHHKESAAILLRYVKISPEVANTMVRATYEVTLQPRLLQPPINIAAKYGNEPVIPADDLIWQPAK